MRRIAFWAVVAGAVWFVATHLREIGAFARAIRGGSLAWLLLAVALQAGFYVLYAAAYRAAFAAAGERRPLRQLVPAVLAALFVNVVTPTAGTAGPALLIDDAVQHGSSGARAAAATLLAQGSVFAAHVIAVAPGMIILAAMDTLDAAQRFALLVLIAIVAAHVAAFALAIRRPATLLSVLLGLADAAERAADAFHRPIRIADDWAERTADDVRKGARLIVAEPAGAARTLGLLVLGYALDLASLAAVTVAYDGRPSLTLVFAAYAVGKLFWIVSPVPQGIGVVEAAMIATLAGFGGEPAARATAIAFAFRGIGFWMPFVIGFGVLRLTGSFAWWNARASDANG